MDREANVSGILSQTVDVLSAAGRSVLIYILLLGLFSGIGGLFGLATMDDNFFSVGWSGGLVDTETAGLLEVLFNLAGLALFVIASYFLLQQMMATIGRPMQGRSRFWSFVGMSILAAIGTMIGFVLLVIPGIIVMVRWSAANGYVLNGEHSVTESLGASWEATDGHGLSIFGAGLVLWLSLAVLTGIVSGVIGGLGLAASSGGVLSPMLAIAVAVSGFLEALTNAASFAFSIAVFHLVAPASTAVADVFE